MQHVYEKTEQTATITRFKEKENQKLAAKEIDQVKAYLNAPDEFYFFKVNDDWLAINHQHKDGLDMLQRYLYIKKSGVRIGKLMGNDLVPDHELALSVHVIRIPFYKQNLTITKLYNI